MNKTFFEDMAESDKLAKNPEATKLIKELMKLGYVVVMGVEFEGNHDLTQKNVAETLGESHHGISHAYGTPKWLARNIMDLYDAKPYLSPLVLAAKFHDQGMHEEAKKLEAIVMLHELQESIFPKEETTASPASPDFPDPDPTSKPC